MLRTCKPSQLKQASRDLYTELTSSQITLACPAQTRPTCGPAWPTSGSQPHNVSLDSRLLLTFMTWNGLLCADVPLRNYSLSSMIKQMPSQHLSTRTVSALPADLRPGPLAAEWEHELDFAPTQTTQYVHSILRLVHKHIHNYLQLEH